MVLNPYDEIEYNTRTKTRQMNPWDNEVSYEEVHGLEELDKVVLYMHSLTFRREVIQKMGAIIDENCFYVDMEYCIFPLCHINSFVMFRLSCLSVFTWFSDTEYEYGKYD